MATDQTDHYASPMGSDGAKITRPKAFQQPIVQPNPDICRCHLHVLTNLPCFLYTDVAEADAAGSCTGLSWMATHCA